MTWFRMTSRINITEEGVDYSGEGAAGTGGGIDPGSEPGMTLFGTTGNEGVSVVVGAGGEDGLEGEFFASGAGC